jgi:hypothetical protein
MRKILVSLLSTLALALFALPVNAAPEKMFSVAISPSPIPAGPATLDATFANETPNGNSTINSLRLTVPAGFTIANTATDPPTSLYPGTIAFDVNAGTISMSGMSPLKPGKSFKLTFKVTAPGSCTVATWNAQAWTGSSFSGDTFLQLFPPAAPSGCSMAFTTQPTGGLSMGLIGGPATIQVSPASLFTGKLITLSFASVPPGTPSPMFAAGTNVAAISPTGVATFPSLSITGQAGAYTLLATTGAAGFPTATSASFNLLASDGVLDCQGQPNGQAFQFGGTNGVSTVSGNRGLNKDNSLCKLVAYDLSFLGPREVALVWDTINQPTATFEYTVDFLPEFVDATTGLPKRTKLAWTLTGATPNYVIGRSCLSPNLPSPYGTLDANGIGAGDTSFPVLPLAVPVTLPAVPFPAVIGTERMDVISVSPTGWTVSRGANAAPHAPSASVMSTPFPVAGGVVQQMCIQDETYVTLPPSQCTPVNANLACVGVSVKVNDGGDGFMSRDF